METKTIYIGLGTFRRPKMLTKALNSLTRLSIPGNCQVSLLVCDNGNDPETSDILTLFSDQLPFKTRLIREKERGIVWVRNRILGEALKDGATHLAFFDDDEEVDPNWLVALTACMDKYEADVVNGKVIYRWPEETHLPERLKAYYARASFPETGKLRQAAGTANVLFDLSLVRKFDLRFHPEHNLRGGEDVLFFNLLHDRGAKIVWCNEGVTYENVPMTRANKEWIEKRKYRYGHNWFYIQKNRRGISYARRKAIIFCMRAFGSYYVLRLVAPLVSSDYSIKLKGDFLYAKGVLDALMDKDYLEYTVVHGS